MKPSPATLHLLRIGFWLGHVHYCISTRLEYRKRGTGGPSSLNTDWWLDRAKLHAKTAQIHSDLYQALHA